MAKLHTGSDRGDERNICFGWNSGGIGKNLGFELKEILLVPHGAGRNDTIVTVERKLQTLNNKE